MGIGIGGEYPLCASVALESSNTVHRGAITGAVFSMQGFGALFASIMGFVMLTMISHSSIDYVWVS
jgi:MFS family permease